MRNEILKYWYQQEFFNPCWPVNPKKDYDLTKKPLPWETKQSDKEIRLSYDIYFGKEQTNKLADWLVNELNIGCADSVEKDDSKVCLCALKIDEEGKYIGDSFAVSSFVWAIFKLANSGSIRTQLDCLELEKLQNNINKDLLDFFCEDLSSITMDNLNIIFANVCSKMNVDKQFFKLCSLWACKKIQHANKKGVFPPLNTSTELMQSFYLEDINTSLKRPTKRLDKYIRAMAESDSMTQRIEVDTDIEQMKNWLKSNVFPLGAWPSKYSLSLMQQIGINIATSSDESIFSINGPPGTGKTTLLKEVVASNIIQRALVMATYDDPQSAFTKAEYKNPIDDYNKTYYKLDDKLSKFGIIVASNNNAAVENISVELPKAISVARTNRFLHIESEIENTYFSDIASELLNEPAWGLISAKLGKKDNIKELKDRLWWAKDNITLKKYFEDDIKPDWKNARGNFKSAYDAVMKEREYISSAQTMLLQQEKEKAIFQAAVDVDNTMKNELLRAQEYLELKGKESNRLENLITVYKQNITLLCSTLPLIKRVLWKLFKNNAVIKEWKQNEQELLNAVILLDQHSVSCNVQKEVVLELKTKRKQKACILSDCSKRLNDINEKIKPYQNKFGESLADSGFWNDISKNKKSQTTCPWVYEDYNMLREELFYQSLMLHKAFILQCNGVKQNLARLFNLWDGKFEEIDRNESYGDLFNTLQLIIPVVSTTFASVQTFLKGIPAEKLGVLVVDEAGQATPQSALGALFRTRKAIIVGDPLQVEPIVTVPKILRQQFADANDILPIYRIPELSVQMLADQLNPFGGIRDLDGEKKWLGCPLIMHRRCIDPMFQISNEIAYNSRMFSQTCPPDSNEKFVFSKSVWVDVKGNETGNKDHTVPQQIEIVVNLIRKAIDIYNGLPNLYIITPFTSVNREIKKAVQTAIKNKLRHITSQDIEDWIESNCGTIHTFQGKEASEVILILGCDVNSGKAAAQWVGQKPNIINVAVSRAKYRLGVIGDYELWKNISNVKTICKYIERNEML